MIWSKKGGYTYELPKTPIDAMDPGERMAESMLRIAALYQHFIGVGVEAKLEGTTLIITNERNHYLIDFADDEPRSTKVQCIYEIEDGNPQIASLVSAIATDYSFGAKAIVRPLGSGYRVHFVAEIFVQGPSDFLAVVELYQSAIESCREKYVEVMMKKAGISDLH